MCLLFSSQDLVYEYSFSVGNSTKKLLYRGRDYQHYFYLPSGDPYDDHKGSFKALKKKTTFKQLMLTETVLFFCCCYTVTVLLYYIYNSHTY